VGLSCPITVFAGAFGHTYGVHPIWQFLTPDRKPVNRARHNWYDDLDLPAAFHLHHLRRLMESRPFLTRVPDQSIVVDAGTGAEHLQATRGQDYLFVYTPFSKKVVVNGGKISGKRLRAWWFDPRTGIAKSLGTRKNEGQLDFTPPAGEGRGHDWVLVLDDDAKHFKAPGKP